MCQLHIFSSDIFSNMFQILIFRIILLPFIVNLATVILKISGSESTLNNQSE